MSDVSLIQVIRTTLTRRGEGRWNHDPVRIITQYWSVEGELLAEVDPFPSARTEPNKQMLSALKRALGVLPRNGEQTEAIYQAVVDAVETATREGV